MSNELQVFNYTEAHQIRTTLIDGEPWFVAKDIADVLGFGDATHATRGLDDDEKGLHILETLGGKQTMTVISEPGLYKLIMRSTKPEAKQFTRWVTHEVLPSIHKSGMYLTDKAADAYLNSPEEFASMAARCSALERKVEAMEKKLEERYTLSVLGASEEEMDEAERVRTRCLKSIRTLPQEKVAELNKVEENEIEAAVSLLKNPRSLDNSLFRGYEALAQQNDTLDVLDQIKKNVQESKTALDKLKRAGLSPEKDITKNKIVRPEQFSNLKGAEVISRTKDTLTLVKGRSLFIYELKRLELKAPATGQLGEKLDLRWPLGQEKARGTKALERE